MRVKFLEFIFLSSLFICFSTVKANENYIVDHVDFIEIDPQLKLSDLLDQTLEKYPDYAFIGALHQESAALNLRGSRWISGAPRISANYKDDFIGGDNGAYELEAGVEVPIWNWGQRDAGLILAEQAELRADNKLNAMKLKVIGFLRQALWTFWLENLRYEMNQNDFQISEKLLKTVQLRVKLGDLPKADFLLAQSEMLQKRTELIHQEAEVMHAMKRISSLTQGNKIPADINETLSTQTDINDNHPMLAEINAIIALKKAKVEWVKSQGSGQPIVGIGGVTERGSEEDDVVDSIAFNVSIPFGGNGFNAPEIAAANREYLEAEAAKAHIHRALSSQIHEAEHALVMERETLKMAKVMQANAEEQMKMAHLSFKAGEINLMDFLKIQARSQSAINESKESTLRLQRNIALYNQAVGVMP